MATDSAPRQALLTVSRQATGVSVVVANEFVFIAGLGLPLLALIAAGVQGAPAALPMLRLLLGLLFVLFAPGYCLQAALFPAAEGPSSGGLDLDGPDRLALSFGLSLALIPPIALVLDGLPWGIRLWPIVVAEALCSTAFSLIALFRRARLPAERRFVLAFELDAPGWWAAQDRVNRRLFGLLGVALVLATIGAAAIIFVPRPGDRFTEFYVLGAGGQAENYPREAAAGEPISVTLGITNREGVDARYRLEVRDGAETVVRMEPLQIAAGVTSEMPLSFAPLSTGDDVRLDFFLYRDEGVEPYRSLQLWLKVTPPAAPGSN